MIPKLKPMLHQLLGRAYEDFCCITIFFFPSHKKKTSPIYLRSLVTRGMFRSFMSRKINIQRSLVQDGESGLVSSSRLLSLSRTDTMLARRGVTTPWTRFQRVCLQRGGEEISFQLSQHALLRDSCLLSTCGSFWAITMRLVYRVHATAMAVSANCRCF